MSKFAKLLVWTLIAVVLPGVAMAEGGGVNPGPGIGAGLAVGMAGLGCGIGQGLTAGNTCAGIARNPGAAGAMFTNFTSGRGRSGRSCSSGGIWCSKMRVSI